MQLDFMSRHPAISEANQQAIKEWLAQYNARMVAFLRLHYGEAGVRAADAISRHAAQKLNEAATAEIKKNEDEYFAWLKATFDEE